MSRGTALNQRSEFILGPRGDLALPRRQPTAGFLRRGDVERRRARGLFHDQLAPSAREDRRGANVTAPHAVALGHVSLLVELTEIHLVRIPLSHGAGPEKIGDGQGEDGGDQRADQKGTLSFENPRMAGRLSPDTGSRATCALPV